MEGGLKKFTTAYKSFGIHIKEDNSVHCKEWAPGAHKLYLYGDFSKFCLSCDCLCFHLQLVSLYRWLGQA